MKEKEIKITRSYERVNKGENCKFKKRSNRSFGIFD